MIEVEVDFPSQIPPDSIPGMVERLCAAEGLALSLKGSLVKYPGCVHWHYQKGKERSTLEITWWPEKKRLWFKVSAGRTAAWIDVAIPRLRKSLEEN